MPTVTSGRRNKDDYIAVPLNDYINFSIQKLKDAFKSSTFRRAAGIGRIPVEFLRYRTDKLYEMVRNLFEQFLNGRLSQGCCLTPALYET